MVGAQATSAAQATQRYAGDSYAQHNPHVADGKQAFVADFERMAREYPCKLAHFKRAVTGSNFVVLRCHQEWHTGGNQDWAGFDIFRFDAQGKVLEHRDVLQVVPEESANGNTMF